jgi:ABC-type sugar transport system substrate-binding protein
MNAGVARERVLYINPMDYGTNPGVDAIAHGLQHSLAQGGLELRVVFYDFARPDWRDRATTAIDAAVSASCRAIVIYVLDPSEPRDAVGRARAAGIPVFSFERPRFPVDGSLVYPNFNQGVLMAEHLADRLAPGATVAVIGGPKIIDDDELVAGIVAGVDRSGLNRVNDPTEDLYRNQTDLRPGGAEVAQRILAEFPHLDGMVPFNDETMLGTLDALAESGRSGIKLVSRNGTPKAVEAVRNRLSEGTWDIDAPGIGSALGRIVVKHLASDEPASTELALGPIGQMIDSSNIDRWRPWPERIPFRPLAEGISHNPSSGRGRTNSN